MAGEQSIQAADLRRIENFLQTINENVNVLDANIDNRICTLSDELDALAQEFKAFVETQVRSNRSQIAETRLVKIRQELDTRFGHYSEVRRTMVGILQADDLGIIRAATISDAVEELMLGAPDYWLAPCLVALSAWINDKPQLSEKALKEALRRDDEKTSLLFTLICSRSGRKAACLKWLRRYLDNQDENNMDSKCIVILDAFAGGLLQADSESFVMERIDEWLSRLNSNPDFIEQQRRQWADAIRARRDQSLDYNYTYLKKHSPTWQRMRDVMIGAELHEASLAYFESIFAQKVDSSSVKKQIDEILHTLVEDFDEDETPLRKNERLEQLVTDFAGNESKASEYMNSVEQIAFERRKNFLQILTDAVLNSQIIHTSPSVRQFAAALSRDWIVDAYGDVTAGNRMQIPGEIAITIDTFSDRTTNGHNEKELAEKLNKHIDEEKARALDTQVLSLGEKLYISFGALLAAAGLFKYASGEKVLGALIMAAGAFFAYKRCVKFFKLRGLRKETDARYEKKRETTEQILRATLAEVVDYRAEFQEKDSGSEAVIDYLRSITPSQYIRRQPGSSRRIHVA